MSADAAATADRGRDWFSPGRFAAVLAAMVLIPFWDVLSGSRCFVVRDFGLFSYPVAGFLRECFWRGEWPLWNPLSCCGTPFLAQLNTLALYPGSLIYILLPLSWALPFFCLLHLYFGGIGMYFLARRWSGSGLGGAVAGTIFACNGLAFNFLMWPSHIATYAWMPWVIWLALDAWETGGRRLVLAALAAALQVLAGGPETILFTWLILGVLMAHRCAGGIRSSFRARLQRKGAETQSRKEEWKDFDRDTCPAALARRFLAMGCLALCLAAAQLLPFIQLSLNSNRSNGYGNAAWSMPAAGWANFLVPLFQTSQWQQIVTQDNQHWTSSYYAGIGAVFLTVMALWRTGSRRVWWLGGMLGLSMVLALGDHGFLLVWLRSLLPFLGLFRYPVKFVLVTLFAFPLLAAAGVAYYENRGSLATRGWRAEWVVGGSLLALIGVILWFARSNNMADHLPWRQIALNGLTRGGFLLLIIALLYFLVRRPVWRGWCGLGLLAVLWLDVLTHEPWQNPTVDPQIMQPGLALKRVKFEPAPVMAGESRVMMSPYSAQLLYYTPDTNVTTGFLLDRLVFIANCNLLDDVPKVDGFFSLYLRYTDKVLSLFDTNAESKLAPLEDVMAVSQTIARGKVFDWVARPSYVPWVSVGQAPVFAGEDATLLALADLKSNFHEMVMLPTEAQASVTARREAEAKIIREQFGAEKIDLEVESPRPTMATISQAWYPSWKASLDGKSVPLWRANEAFQAVEVPAGRHEVKLQYEDAAFRWGGVVSILALLVCGVCWVRFGAGGIGSRPNRRAITNEN